MKETLMAQRPNEGEWFEVNPETINKNLFQKKRKNPKQEEIRQIILEAFTEVKNNPEKYPGKFKTMMPQKTWKQKSIKELKNYASYLGNRIADWVEQVLEWAQRINNGETWETICNEPDTSNWYRLVLWKEDSSRLVGGCSKLLSINNPPSYVYSHSYHSNTKLHSAVPLVVLYE